MRILKSVHVVDKKWETQEAAEGRGGRQEGYYRRSQSSSLKLMQMLQIGRGRERELGGSSPECNGHKG